MMSKHTIYSASNVDDSERLLEFFNLNMIKRELHWFTHRKTIMRAMERDDRRLYYIENANDIVAGLMVWCESRVLEDDQAQIRQVATHPDHRSQGYGRQLCEKAESFSRSWGKKVMVADVAVDSPAVSFWKSCGYSFSEEWETQNGRSMARVEKPL